MGSAIKFTGIKSREFWAAAGNQIVAWRNAVRRRLLYGITKSHYQVRRWSRARAPWIEIAIWLLAAVVAALLLPAFQTWLVPRLDDKAMAGLQTIAVTIGGAMIGATAIASSFVLFAMQVNVERLPYRLFYRFSSDWKLLAAFAVSFVAAIGGTALSLFSKESDAATLIVLELAAVTVVLRLLLLAYRRSLHLVNPEQQLAIIYRLADKNLRRVDRHIRWSGLPQRNEQEDAMDTSRRAILDANPGWDRLLRETIEHAVAFSRRAGELGDLEISAKALNLVVALNNRYIDVKGRTFFANNLLIDNPLVTDGTINATLEALRRLREAALIRRDEPHVEQVFGTYAALVQAYLRIEYGRGQSRSHALLATGYLKRAIEAAVPHSLIDAVMQGVRLLGRVGQQFFVAGESAEGVDCVSQITVFGMVGAASEKHRPLTLAAMEELRDLLLVLLRVEEPDIGFAARELRESVSQVATAFLAVPDTPLTSTHSAYLAPFYSSTSYSSFRAHLTNLVNALQDAPDPAAAERVADHIEIWADGLYEEPKNLLLLAIEKRSHFAFDMVHWITGITELLLAASRAPHTREHTRAELEKDALWLFSALTWIPTDKDTVRFVENLSFRSEVFETALRAQRDDWFDGFEAAWKLAFKWALDGGSNPTGWGTLQRWPSALCALALRSEVNRGDLLKAQLTARLQDPTAPNHKLRDGAARDLREMADEIRMREFEMDLVKRILAQNDQTETRTLLREVADILSPHTAGEPVRPRWLLGDDD